MKFQGGKQLPLGLAGGKQIPHPTATKKKKAEKTKGTTRSLPTKESSASNEAKEIEDSITWTLREASIELIKQRQLQEKSKQQLPEMHLSDQFGNLDTTLMRIRRDKSLMIRKSFDAAALTVLHATILKRNKKTTTSSVGEAIGAAFGVTADDDNNKMKQDIDEDRFRKSLPACLRQYKELEGLRAVSLDRSHDNKEYAKRKGGKKEAPLVLVNAAKNNKSLLPGSSMDIKKDVDKRKNSEAEKIDSAEVDKTTSKSSASNTDKSINNTSSRLSGKSGTVTEPVTKDAGTSGISRPSGGVDKLKGTSGGHDSRSGTATPTVPKFTRNTPASSAAALDFRFNSSRAILCVAGNIMFEALTPGFSGRESIIDVLDVPQNPSSKKYNKTKEEKKKKRKRKESDASSEGNDDEEDNKSDKEDNDVSDEDDDSSSGISGKNSSSNEKKVSSQTTSSSSVNMGAVSVEAQMLGQRTICVVENATKRAALRYQCRKENAKYRYDDCSNIHHFRDGEENTLLRLENPFSWKPDSTDISKAISKEQKKITDKKTRIMQVYTEKNKEKSKRKNMFSPGTLLHMDVESEGSDDEETGSEHSGDSVDRIRRDNRKSFLDHIDDSDESYSSVQYKPSTVSITKEWQSVCLPRFLKVLSTGAGHAIYHDVQWSSRHGRIADLFRTLTTSTPDNHNTNYGPHLIVTTEPDMIKFAQEFYDLQDHLQLLTGMKSLRALMYHGSMKRRTKLRTDYFAQATGLPEAPFHVLITTYATLFEDYIHFCQFPFETVLLDDGVSFMATCDQNSVMGSIWDSAVFSSNDQHVGLAGTSFKEWDYSKNTISEATMKESVLIGLTTRHRIMTASSFVLRQRQTIEYIPVSSLVDFVAPQFSTIAQEEWSRSRIVSDAASMKHFRSLVTRSMIVHYSCEPSSSSTTPIVQDLYTLALFALKGKLPSPDRSSDPEVPEVLSDDDFVSSSKVAFSRRSALLWLGQPSQSWLRYELGKTNFQPILDAMRASNFHGHFCEEITTASSMTTTGANGQVAGTMAFRCGVRCGRHFGSEQGLRLHISALHAPPGTWLCRTCGSDCITSQARTHHERSCGQPAANGDHAGSVGATPTVGQGSKTKGGVGKKKAAGRPGIAQPGASTTEEKDAEGSFRVPGYRGVWVNKDGRHFVKLVGKLLTDNRKEDGKPLFFDNIDDAARMHDKIANKEYKNDNLELNFKPDGSRIIYEDITPASTSGLGGSAANVVPALSVINIKDLPPDVKPLLRDPRQTSRTGGNSKRHIYAYRGVCRQARKGHDRWQSQISFMGVNHYLGTFDSEWDAAAIYAWAHLILYGEEATRQAQKEGEEAAAAYEQEKKDIASGKIPEPPPKAEKKKTKIAKKNKDGKNDDAKVKRGKEKDTDDEKSGLKSKKRKRLSKESPLVKTGKPVRKMGSEKETLAPILAKGVRKASAIAPREAYEGKSDSEMLNLASQKIVAARDAGYCASVSSKALSGATAALRPCLPVSLVTSPFGGAMMLGLPPSLFGWDLQDFVESCDLTSEQDTMAALQLLAVEYDDDGVNEKFKSVVQGTLCIIGSASQKTYESLGLGRVPVGGVCGRTDCHIGGVPGSCSETAACIHYLPTEISEFQFSCLSDDDIVTLNGRRITPDLGSFPLFNEDICSVGARVFVFLIPTDK